MWMLLSASLVEEEERIVKGDDVVVELDATSKTCTWEVTSSYNVLVTIYKVGQGLGQVLKKLRSHILDVTNAVFINCSIKQAKDGFRDA
ncbi:unnamed protein product [Sphenostylis stenocarpa]|uniref:Uncharacterized protein n=1 Tax=Sphenostylis stenocarpa TaxID=92480 RepID=A0AA86T6R2_9FABA|nr:unnamed protein product [Sphenostylis stenocarpa]